jgi:hypothetical protein
MTTSRRKFLRAGTVGIFGAVAYSQLGKLAMGQEPQANSERTDLVSESFVLFRKSNFTGQLNSQFFLRMGYSDSSAVTLVAVRDSNPNAKRLKSSVVSGKECFLLVFNSSQPLPQGTYAVEHAVLGSFMMFLVPSGTEATPKMEAVINRLNG